MQWRVKEGMKLALCVMGVCMALIACDVYDDMSLMPQSENGDGSFSYIDATDYKQWIYLNLEDGTGVTLEYDDTLNIPEQWTFALHRYDCKTNGGAAMETEFGSLEELQTALNGGEYSFAQSQFVPDTQDSIIIDMSHMMDGWLEYAPAMLNKEMGKWLDVDTSEMPPIYTASNRVYIICTREGTYAAVRFTAYSNPFYYDAKGYILFDYLYPLEI